MTLTVSFQHRRRGDVSVDLFSPSGTRNEMLSTRRYDDSKNGLHDWTFMTVHNWGENPKGVWVMNVTDNIATLNKGVDVNGYLQHDTSKQEADVEDLEEEVSFLVLDNSFTWAYTYNNNNELYLHYHTNTYSIAKAMFRNQNYNIGQLRYFDNNLSRKSKQAEKYFMNCILIKYLEEFISSLIKPFIANWVISGIRVLTL